MGEDCLVPVNVILEKNENLPSVHGIIFSIDVISVVWLVLDKYLFRFLSENRHIWMKYKPLGRTL